MNSIRRARRRPRVTSYRFRTFGWVLTREAALRVLYPASLGGASERQARHVCCSGGSTAIRGIAEKLLAFRSDRRFYP